MVATFDMEVFMDALAWSKANSFTSRDCAEYLCRLAESGAILAWRASTRPVDELVAECVKQSGVGVKIISEEMKYG